MKLTASRLQCFFCLVLLYCHCYILKAQNPTFSNGADVSWLSQMEATGYVFYDTDGSQKDCLQLLKDRGINTIRLRVWVNPSNDKINGHCSAAETVTMAVRAQQLGMRIMIDFHYSDSWADPGKQNKPAAWATHTFSQLLDDVYNHTYSVLDDLKTAGVTPEWVQIGNEIPSGMLWPEGNTSNWGQLAQLLNKGYDATKAINTAIKVIVHIDQGNNNSRFRYFFDNATANNVKYDVIGLSYYPYWLNSDYTVTINDLQNNLIDMVNRYGKEVMVVEVGGDFTLVQNTYDMLTAVIAAVKNVPNNKGLGVVYWEPQGEKSWSGYQLNAWQSNGKPSPALDAFKGSLTTPIEKVKIDGFVSNPVEQGSNVTVNLTYTANEATHYFYAGVFKRNASGGWMQTISESSGNQFLVPQTGADKTTTISLTIPPATTPSSGLANGEYYDFYVELWTQNWGTKLGTDLSSVLTIAQAGSLGINTETNKKKVVIYPNPVNVALKLQKLDNMSMNYINIRNILGANVITNATLTEDNSIDVSHLSTGIYVLSIHTNSGIQQFKFCKN